MAKQVGNMQANDYVYIRMVLGSPHTKSPVWWTMGNGVLEEDSIYVAFV